MYLVLWFTAGVCGERYHDSVSASTSLSSSTGYKAFSPVPTSVLFGLSLKLISNVYLVLYDFTCICILVEVCLVVDGG